MLCCCSWRVGSTTALVALLSLVAQNVALCKALDLVVPVCGEQQGLPLMHFHGGHTGVPEERVAIASAYEEASGWLEEMHGYFADKLSDANLRNVMKQATALATGAGVPHTIRANYFRKGQPVTLDEDLVALRIEANRFLRPEDDPGHGWRLDHPIGKMALFQMHLHEARS